MVKFKFKTNIASVVWEVKLQYRLNDVLGDQVDFWESVLVSFGNDMATSIWDNISLLCQTEVLGYCIEGLKLFNF